MAKLTQGIDTLAVHAGHTPDKETNSRAVPIYQTSSYVFNDTDHAANLFALREFGNIYTRLMNPTTDVLESASRQSTAARARSPRRPARRRYFTQSRTSLPPARTLSPATSCTGHLHAVQFPLKRFGIEARFVDSSNPSNFEKKIDEKTRLIYTESIGNPKGNIDDFEAIAEIAHKHKIPFVIDNTVSPPPLFNPFDHGADIAVYSLTKMIGGHGTSIGGAVVEKGDFDWKAAGKYPEITEPDLAYHGVNFWTHSADTRTQLLQVWHSY